MFRRWREGQVLSQTLTWDVSKQGARLLVFPFKKREEVDLLGASHFRRCPFEAIGCHVVRCEMPFAAKAEFASGITKVCMRSARLVRGGATGLKRPEEGQQIASASRVGDTWQVRSFSVFVERVQMGAVQHVPFFYLLDCFE